MKALIVFFLLIGMSTFAQEKKEVTELDTSFKFHSQIFFNYSYTQNPLTEKRQELQGFNQENNRFYFGFTKNINKMISTKFTLDFGKTTKGNYGAFLKVGKAVLKFNKQNKLTAGMFFNPIHSAVHKLWGHRYIKVAYGASAGSNGYWNAVPVGLMFSHDMGDMLKAHISIANGSGYKYVGDNDKNKNIDLNLISTPIKGLDIALNLSYILNIAEDQATQFGANLLLSYSMDMFKVGGQVLFKSVKDDGADDAVISMGYVGYLRVMPMKTVEVFFTGYMDDPHTDSADDVKDVKFGFMGGIEYVMTNKIRAALSYEMNWIEDQKNEDSTDKDKESVIWASTFLSF